MKVTTLRPEFVEVIPEDVEEGVLYISRRFRTATHLCACGCGTKVVTPLKPAKWALSEDGGLVTLRPSIGRWQLPCKSHYWITDNEIEWARPISEPQMQRVLERDAAAVRQYYASRRKKKWIPTWLSRLWRRITKGV